MPRVCPSSTARLIACCTLLAAADPKLQALVPPAAIDPLERILNLTGSARGLSLARRNRFFRTLLFQLERWVLPGIILHYLARKRWLENIVLTALHAGCEQVVALGAGFDTLLWRLHRDWPEVLFCELDQPATQRPKAAALVSLAVGGNFLLQPVDLGTELPTTVLRRLPRFNPAKRTCFVAEGLLMYFPEQRVTEILGDLATLHPASIVFTFMEPGLDGRAAFRGRSTLVNAWLRHTHEPFAWAISSRRLGDFLRGVRLKVQLLAGAPELRRAILEPVGLANAALAEGELLCCAIPAS